MSQLPIAYRTAGKALPPRKIRMDIPGWGGSPEKKMENGSEPQAWHCAPFTSAATYGLELVYQYETECHVVNEGGQVKIHWDYAREPGGVLGADEFTLTSPKPSLFYTFATSIDLQAPSGYVLRTEPHPRFYTDRTGSVPEAVIGHIQSEWWPKKLFCVFKAPAPGQRHVFRKGEPYVQILFVAEDTALEPVRMDEQEASRRASLEDSVKRSKSQIAKKVWFNPSGSEFNDHYKVLARAFGRGGHDEVTRVIDAAAQRESALFPPNKNAQELLELAEQYRQNGKLVEASTILFRVCLENRNNVKAIVQYGALAEQMGQWEFALAATSQATQLDPRSAEHPNTLGEMLFRQSRFADAEGWFRHALRLAPSNPDILSNLGMALAHQGRAAEARALFDAALAINPNFEPARQGLSSISSGARTDQSGMG